MAGFDAQTLRLDDPEAIPGLQVTLSGDPDEGIVKINPKTKVAEVKLPDGAVAVYLDGYPGAQEANDNDNGDFYANIADKIGSEALGVISNELLIGIDTDDRSRADWLEARAEGMKLLALKIEDGKSASSSDSTPVEGMSRFRHPLLLEAVIRGHANAQAELLPTDGPVKVRDDDIHPTMQRDDDANMLERTLNHFFTATDRAYYPDTRRMLWWVFFGGCAFKKIHHNPIKRRPCSESVDAVDIIVSNGAVDINSAPRVTHRIKMGRSMLKRMQIVGAYRKVDLGQPITPTVTSVDEEKQAITGITPSPNVDGKDLEYELFECYCELDIPGFEHKTDGEADGLPIPYKVTIDKNSREILEVRRNWAEDDDLCLPRIPFVKFCYIDAIGFYGIGLAHCLGSITNAITALAREMIDAGMFANFPGGLVVKGATRQNQSQFRPAPGEFSPVETNGMKISDAVMPMPYKEPGPAMFQMTDSLTQTGTRLGGTAEIMVGEGRQDAPVGTTVAMIEQATKPLDAVHKGLHTSQSEEVEKFVECVREDPEGFLKSLKRPPQQWDVGQFLRALDDYDLVPVADPNTSSRLQRIGKAQTVYQMAKDNPLAFNQKAVYDYVGEATGVGSMDQFLAEQSAQPPDPKALADQAKAQAASKSADADMLGAQVKAADLKLRQQNQSADYANQAADRQADLQMAQSREATEKVIHGTQLVADHVAQQQSFGHAANMHRAGSVADYHSEQRDQAHDIRSKVLDSALTPKPSPATPGRKSGGRVNKSKLAKASEAISKLPDFSPPRQAPDGKIYTMHKPTGVYHRVDGIG